MSDDEDTNNCLLVLKIISNLKYYHSFIDIIIGILSENNIDELYIDIERMGFRSLNKQIINFCICDNYYGPSMDIIIKKNIRLELKYQITIHKIKKILNIKNKMKKIERFANDFDFSRRYSMQILDYDKYANKADEYKKKLKKYIKKLFKPQVVPFKKELLYKFRMKHLIKIY